MHTITILIATDLENSNKTAFANQILPEKDKKEYFSQSKVSITVSMGTYPGYFARY